MSEDVNLKQPELGAPQLSVNPGKPGSQVPDPPAPAPPPANPPTTPPDDESDDDEAADKQ